MTRIFDESGNHVPVTVLSVEKSVVTQIKTLEKDGYTSVKFAYQPKRESLISNPEKAN